MVLPDIAILFEWNASKKRWTHCETKISKSDSGFTRHDNPLEWLSSGDINGLDYDPLGAPGRLVVGWDIFHGLLVWGFTDPKGASRDWFRSDLPTGDEFFRFVQSKGPTGLHYFTGCYENATKQVAEVLSTFIGATLTLPD